MPTYEVRENGVLLMTMNATSPEDVPVSFGGPDMFAFLQEYGAELADQFGANCLQIASRCGYDASLCYPEGAGEVAKDEPTLAEVLKSLGYVEKTHYRLTSEQTNKQVSILHTDGDGTLIGYDGDNPPVGYEDGMLLSEFLATHRGYTVEVVPNEEDHEPQSG